MTFNWRPRSSRAYLPRQGAISDAINRSYTTMFSTNRGIIGAPQFEEPQTSLFIQGGRAGIQGGDFLSETLMPMPARSIEAPLRPFDVATGGALGRGIQDFYQGARNTPILGNILGAVEGTVGILEASNKAARALLNQGVANKLVETAGMRPTDMVMIGSDLMTVQEFRDSVMRKWSVNEFTGERMSLEQLTERARTNTWDFGEFATSDNGVMGFIQESVVDPVNLAMIPLTIGGGAALRGVASWARPAMTNIGRAPYMPRVGVGALARLRGNVTSVPFARGTQYLEQLGNLGPGPATLGNVMHLAQNLYFPKYGLMRAPRASQLTQAERLAGVRTGLGLNRPTAALASWQLGGAGQMAATSLAEHGVGLLTQRQYDEELGMAPVEQPGWLDDIQDTLHAINNSHPLSDNQTFTVLAMFSPWMRSINAAFKGRGRNPAAYYNDVALHLSRQFEDTGVSFKSERDFLEQLGDGDYALGVARLERLVDQTDVVLVRNQFSDFTNAAINTIEDKVQRSEFLAREVVDSVLARRASGALGGRSGADNIIRFYREGWSPNPETRLARANRTISWDGFKYAVAQMHNAAEAVAIDGFAHMGSLIVGDGAPITKELIGGLLNRLAHLDPAARIPRAVASEIIERNPALIYMGDFWQEFSYTLGQMLENTGKKGAEPLPTEGVTVAQVRSHLEELIDEAPRADELYHEPLQVLERRRVNPVEAPKVLSRTIPEDSPRALASMRKRFVTIGTHADAMRQKVVGIRNAEFFRNGKPRWEAAKELVGHFGGKFIRQDENTFVKQAPRIELFRVRSSERPEPTITFPEQDPDYITGSEVFKDDMPDPVDNRGNVPMRFENKDHAQSTFWAHEAYEATIGDKEVYIFRPDESEVYYVNRALPYDDTFFTPVNRNWYEDRGKFNMAEGASDMWFVARKDGNGTLLINQGFNTAKEAAEWTNSISDQHVSVQIEDGVITITGKIAPPVRAEVSDWAEDIADSTYADMEAEVLNSVRHLWTEQGKTRRPHSVVHEDSPMVMPGYSRPDRAYHFIGDDGLPAGTLRIQFDQHGEVSSLDIYVDPAYRGPKSYGQPVHMIYDKAFADGIDLSKVSGTVTTRAGARHTSRYWASRRDTMDTEALELAVKSGGRIIEVDMMPAITTKKDPAVNVVFSSEPAFTETLEAFDVDPADLEGGSFYTMELADGPAIVYPNEQFENVLVIRHPDGTIESHVYSSWRTMMKDIGEEVEILPAGSRHAETLARWGFEEVARYGADVKPKLYTMGYNNDLPPHDYATRGDYGYHFRPMKGLDRVRRRGLEPGISRPGEPAGVYFGEDPDSAMSLAPPKMVQDSVLFRVQRDKIIGAESRFDTELIHEGTISPDDLEFWGDDGQWHPLNSTEKAVFAYRGGDTSKALLNSRIEGANQPYRPIGEKPVVFSKSTYKSRMPADDSPDYYYRFQNLSRKDEITRRGTINADIRRPSLAEGPNGVFFAGSHADAWYLAPANSMDNSMLIRVKRSKVNLKPAADKVSGGKPVTNEFISEGPVSIEHMEYWTEKGWRPLAEVKRTGRRTKTRAAALNLARKRANDASLQYPSLDTLGPGYTSSRKFFSAQERRAHLNELNKALGEQAASAAESVQHIDDTLALVSGLEKVTDIKDWWDVASADQIENLTRSVKTLNAEWPALQVMDGGIFIDPRRERFGHLMTGYSTMARHVFDYGFLSPISRFYDAMFTPKHARALQKDVMAELNVQTALVGMTPDQTRRFMEGVRQRVAESRSASGLGSIVGLHKSRNIRALDESTLRVLVEEAAGEEVLNRVLDRFGHVQKMVTEAANGLMRRSAQRARMGGKVSKLEASANAAWRHYQFDPILEHASNATHSMSKFWYPLLRFTADPLFVMMNLIEPYVYGISRNGVRAMRGKRSQVQQEINKRAIDRASRHSIPAGGFADVEELPIETLMTDAGVFSIPRNMRPSIEKEHQIGRMESYVNVLQDIPKSDPLAQLFQERFGTADPKQWAKEMDEIMYGWLNEGPEQTVMQSFAEMAELYGWTSEELQIMAPFMQRLGEMHRALYDDLADLYIGRLNRTGIERVLDNFWLLWPLSYTIKATKWLASIMFYKVGGVRTGPLGAIMYDEYRTRFLRAVENDEDLQQWMEDNRDFIFLFEMFLPMSPESIGVSVNRFTRISASWLNSMTLDDPGIADAIGDYDYIESIPEGIETGMRFGPVRTYNLFKRLMNQLEVPGWTYDQGGSGGSSLDNYQPATR